MASVSASSPIKPYQQIIASGSGAVVTALFMTLDINIKHIVDKKENYSFYSILIFKTIETT